MSLRTRNRLTDKETVTARHDRLRFAYKYGEYIDEHTTIPGITPVAEKHKTADELRRDFMRRIKQCQ